MVASEDCTCQLWLPVQFSWSVRLLLNYYFNGVRRLFNFDYPLLPLLEELLSHEKNFDVEEKTYQTSMLFIEHQQSPEDVEFQLRNNPKSNYSFVGHVKIGRNYSYFSLCYLFSFAFNTHIHTNELDIKRQENLLLYRQQPQIILSIGILFERLLCAGIRVCVSLWTSKSDNLILPVFLRRVFQKKYYLLDSTALGCISHFTFSKFSKHFFCYRMF